MGAPGSQQYSMEDRERAVLAYVRGGTLVKAAATTGINWKTIQSWRDRDETWWAETEERLRLEHDREFKAELQEISVLGLREWRDRIVNGDYVVSKDGAVSRRPMSGHHLTIAVGTLIDKVRAMPAQPTASTSTDKMLKDKLAALEQAARARAVEEGKLVEMGRGTQSDAVAKKG